MTVSPAYNVYYHGNEKQPVVVIDNFVAHPEILVETAAAKPFAAKGPYYPGIRRIVASDYMAETTAMLTEIFKTVFNVKQGIRVTECAYSLVTTKPRDLQPIQRLPHYDSTSDGLFALLHFLSTPEQGGTSFFRHVATGFETISDERYPIFKSKLEDEVAQDGLPPLAYFTQGNHRFEKIATYDAAFNRALIYRGFSFHSGNIPADLDFSADPKSGRLTVNTFLQGQ